MIGRVLGAYMGDKLARNISGIAGPTGAAIGVLAPTLLRRLSLPGMIALGAGGYIAKRFFEQKDREDAGKTHPSAARAHSTVATPAE